MICVGRGNSNGFRTACARRSGRKDLVNPTYPPAVCLQLAVISAAGRSAMSRYRKTNPSKPDAMRWGRMPPALQVFITLCPSGAGVWLPLRLRRLLTSGRPVSLGIAIDPSFRSSPKASLAHVVRLYNQMRELGGYGRSRVFSRAPRSDYDQHRLRSRGCREDRSPRAR